MGICGAIREQTTVKQRLDGGAVCPPGVTFNYESSREHCLSLKALKEKHTKKSENTPKHLVQCNSGQ